MLLLKLSDNISVIFVSQLVSLECKSILKTMEYIIYVGDFNHKALSKLISKSIFP